MNSDEKLKAIPSVDSVLMSLESGGQAVEAPRPMVVQTVRATLTRVRQRIVENQGSYPGTPDQVREAILEEIADDLGRARLRGLLAVINGTGVIIHTNLGRAPISAPARARIDRVAEGYSNLEYDLVKGRRGKRDLLVRDALCELTGAEDALVVNNNAAGVLLALNTLAYARDVLVSRGELIEIGDSFRLPDVFRKSGVGMVEVGTTNRTKLADFRRAITNRTGAILSAHWSNYRIAGFVERVALEDLVELGAGYGIPVIHDLGSGALIDTASLGLPREATVRDSVRAKATVATFSGDKLLGGPQAGIVVGRAETISEMRTNPLARALRPCKLTLAGLEATLLHYLRGEAIAEIPVLRMMTTPLEELQARGAAIREALRTTTEHSLEVSVVASTARIGGGALPEREIESRALEVRSPTLSAASVAQRLLSTMPPVVARTVEGRTILDLRTIMPRQDELVVSALREVSCSDD